MIKAGGEEKALAIANNDYHDDIPAITVVCDGGWSKRSFVCLFVWFLTTHQPLWVISVRRY